MYFHVAYMYGTSASHLVGHKAICVINDSRATFGDISVELGVPDGTTPFELKAALRQLVAQKLQVSSANLVLITFQQM